MSFIHRIPQMTGLPIESEALLTVARICSMAVSYGNDTALIVRSEGESSGLIWSGSFSYECRVFSMFRLFEWLLRLPEEAQTLRLMSDNTDAQAVVLYPANEGRGVYRRRFEPSGAAFDEAAWISSLLGCDIGGLNDTDILRMLSRRAVFFDREAFLPVKEYTDGCIELDVSHPLVLLARMRALFLLDNEIVWKSTLSYGKYALADNDERFDAWPFLERTLRQPLVQFYPWGDAQEVYVLDPRFGTLATQTFFRCKGATSLFPAAVTNIAEKLLLDIKDYESDSVRIALVGSIVDWEAQTLADTLGDMLENPRLKLELNIVSSVYFETNERCDCEHDKKEGISLSFSYPDTLERDMVLEIIRDNDIVFLVDPWLLYERSQNCVLAPSIRPDAYLLTESTMRNDVLHFSQWLADRYLIYDNQLKLDIEWLLSECERMQAETKHLCILTSYSTLTDLISQSGRAQEIRKELVAPHQYTTLLRYTFPSNRASEENESEQLPCFIFRLHQWYKMFAPYLCKYKLTNEKIPADKLLRNVICKLSVEKGEWIVRMYCPDLDEQTRRWLAERTISRINYAVEGDRLAGAARGYAKKSLINLLISRSISLRHLLAARSLLYNNSNSISIELVEDDPDIADYEAKMRKYRKRYSDYLLMCSIDKSEYTDDTLSQAMQLIIAFGQDNGLYTIHRLGAESESMLRQGYGISPAMRDFFMRMDNQAARILR